MGSKAAGLTGPHCRTPNFLGSLVALATFMRLSLLKVGYVVVGWSHIQEIRGFAAGCARSCFLLRPTMLNNMQSVYPG